MATVSELLDGHVTLEVECLDRLYLTLINGAAKHLTYTNARGQFIFGGNLTGKATVQAPGVVQVIPQIQSTRRITLHP